MSAPDPLAALRADLAGRYELQDEIGRGGMAEVYKSTHPTLHKPVAIKILPEHLAALDFAAAGLATVRVGAHFYYFRPDGRSARVPTWDNWADDFADGLVRTVRKVGGVEKFVKLGRLAVEL